jgi:DNA helicase HerA-like ATPase
MKNRLQDSRFSFLFQPPTDYAPSRRGKCNKDIGELVSSWVGHDKPVTVLDVSAVPSEVLTIIIGALLRVIYEVLFWAGELDCGGRKQPLLIVLEEAHLFLPNEGEGPAQEIVSKIAKEGRKYGVGIMLVSQRPTDLDASALSQCGSIVALRTTNASDRSRIESSLPDDLGEIGGTLPALRTGEGVVIGEAVPAPSRIRFDLSIRKDEMSSPSIKNGWRKTLRPAAALYDDAVANWRAREYLFPEDHNG